MVLLVLACGDSSPEPRGDVGKVIEVAGKVTATRDAATRTLAAGTPVTGDDVIATAADSSVVIEISHNHARWTLEAGLTSRVDASPAWALPLQEAAPAVEHATSSAGRHADRQAADTQITAQRDDDERARAKLQARAEADELAARSQLEALRQQGGSVLKRPADKLAKDDRKSGVKITPECVNNPLARDCGEPALEADAKVAVSRIRDFATELCTCKTDLACVRRVDSAYQTWRAQLGKRHPPASKIGDQIASGGRIDVDRYEQCRAAAKL